MEKRKVILYISMSLDGYVATENDDISFLETVSKEGEDYGYFDFVKTIDTYIIGRKSFEVVKNILNGDFPQAKSYKCYIITRQKGLTDENDVTFYSGDIKELISKLRSEEGKHIYCDGGPQIVKLFLDEGLIDEFIISVIPVVLGGGKKLFMDGIPYQQFKHVSTKSYDTGLVQLHYTKEDL